MTGIDGIQLAVEAVLNGEMAGTVAWDPYWQGGMGLSIGYHAKTGKFDPSKEPKEHREFYGKGVIITAENAQEFYDTNIKAEPKLDWNDIWGRVERPDPVLAERAEPAAAATFSMFRGRRRSAGLARSTACARMSTDTAAIAAVRHLDEAPGAGASSACGSRPGRRCSCCRALRRHHRDQPQLP